MNWWERSMLLALVCAAATGCVATVGVESAAVYGYPVVYAEAPPTAAFAVYPGFYFPGTYAYLIDGAWHYPTPRGWVVFREEPPELYRYRTRYVRPEYWGPAPGRPYRGYPAYPAYPASPRERPRRYYPR